MNRPDTSSSTPNPPAALEPTASALPAGPHRSRLDLALLDLLHNRRIAALGTLQADGAPFVSMVPYALHPDHPVLILHVSALAAHRRQMEADARVSLLVCAAQDEQTPTQALGRVTLNGQAQILAPGSADWQLCRDAYLQRYPQAEPITALPDFAFVAIELHEARQVAGFGAARSLSSTDLQALWAAPPHLAAC
ncbi:MAG: pyridoxamine 5'-phosphate oxidase family protein [Leptothrix sp. (in: b-proteobacteria)]